MSGSPADSIQLGTQSAERARFAELVTTSGGFEAIPLAEAALWLAAEDYEHLDVEYYLRRLDDLGAEAAQALAECDDETERIVGLNEFLFQGKRFIGNQSDYYDPRNSFLNEVLERRTGIPITLSILYIEVATRVGIQVEGVGFPGHFLVRAGENGLMIDPFGGRVLTRKDCLELLREAAGERAQIEDHHMAQVSAGQILARMLANLKQIYLQNEEYERALPCIERVLLLMPGSPLELRDRGLIFAKLECFGPALVDLEAFLEQVDEKRVPESVLELIEDLRTRVRQIH